jgi:beta-glucosidase
MQIADELLRAGIQPFATLYHWDLPQAFKDQGGWQSRDVTNAFADYASCLAKNLGDRVKHFCTINECHTFVEQGHSHVQYQSGGDIVKAEMAP